MTVLSKGTAEAIQRINLGFRVYQVLIEVCGARESDQEGFASYFSEQHRSHEWRFCGHLGSGGKFYIEEERWYVDCYPMERTVERDCMIDRANRALAKLKAEFDTQEAKQ